MSSLFHELGIDRLSPATRLQLLDEIWNSLLPLTHSEIPESHRAELDRRIDEADQHPNVGYTWEEVKARLRGER